MKPVHLVLFCIVLLYDISCQTEPPNNPDQKEWVSIFNGKDLTGWDIKIAGYDLNDNYNQTFRVEDSILKVDYSRYEKFDGKFGHLYYKEPLSYYIIRTQYRFEGHQLKGAPEWGYLNSGVMLHSQSAKSVNKNQTFPVSLEMQLLASDDSLKRHTCNLCTPGTQVSWKGRRNESHCIDSNSKSYKPEQWVTAQAVVLGDSVIHHMVDGDTVLTYEHPIVGGGFVSLSNSWTTGAISDSLAWINKAGTPLKEGYIALQAESHPVWFKKIELLNLKGCTDPKAKNYKSYYLKSDRSACKY